MFKIMFEKESSMKPVMKLVVAILPVLLIIGCGTTEVKEEPAETGAAVSTTPGGGVTTTDASEGTRLGDGGTVGEAVPMTEPEPVVDQGAADADLLSERKIYFDFDRSEIKPEYSDILQAHAEYLVANPGTSIVVEGHCDERGTREYNIALGERRAHSVLQFLTLQGVSKDQVRTVSFGEERPDVEGHEESAWKWNRRAVFVYSE
jgi:peptidoglycan-associated lipoprotein